MLYLYSEKKAVLIQLTNDSGGRVYTTRYNLLYKMTYINIAVIPYIAEFSFIVF